MNLKTAEFAATLSEDELVRFSELMLIWDIRFERALEAATDEDMKAIVEEMEPMEITPEYKSLMNKLKIHNSKLDLDII